MLPEHRRRVRSTIYATSIGLAAVEARHRPEDDDRNVRLPNVSIVLGTDKPVERKGAAPYMPDVVVEIQWPDNTGAKCTSARCSISTTAHGW